MSRPNPFHVHVPGRRARAAGWSRSRPRIEVLEQRALLATVNWISTSDGNWNVGSNWNTGNVPGSGDDAVIDVSGAQPKVTINTDVSVHSLTAADPLVLAGGSLTVASQS